MQQQSAEPTQSEVVAVSDDGPLPPEELAAYLDGRLSAEKREQIEKALADSDEARAELVEVSRLIATLPARRAPPLRRWFLVSAVAAAAVLAVVLVPSLSRKPPTESVATERPASAGERGRIRTTAPEDGAAVSPAGLRFVWHSVPGATYQLTLTDAQGSTVWQASTTDTTLALPSSANVSGPASYYWNVDALAPDGSSTSTGVRELRVTSR